MSLNLPGTIERSPNQFLPKAKIHECDQCHEYDESNQCLLKKIHLERIAVDRLGCFLFLLVLRDQVEEALLLDGAW